MGRFGTDGPAVAVDVLAPALPDALPLAVAVRPVPCQGTGRSETPRKKVQVNNIQTVGWQLCNSHQCLKSQLRTWNYRRFDTTRWLLQQRLLASDTSGDGHRRRLYRSASSGLSGWHRSTVYEVKALH